VGSEGELEEALAHATDTLKRALSQANTQLPRDESGEEAAFSQVCRKLKLKRIDEQLSHIAKLTGQAGATGELTEEIRRLQGERIDLLALKKRVLDELPSPPGNKP
jgi:DNA primase